MVGQEALRSQMFRQYVVLYVHFCTMNFIQKLGIDKDKLKGERHAAGRGK